MNTDEISHSLSRSLERVPVRKVLLGATLLFALWSGARWIERGFQSVAPGEAGLVVSKFTGTTRVVPPGRSISSSSAAGSFCSMSDISI